MGVIDGKKNTPIYYHTLSYNPAIVGQPAWVCPSIEALLYCWLVRSVIFHHRPAGHWACGAPGCQPIKSDFSTTGRPCPPCISNLARVQQLVIKYSEALKESCQISAVSAAGDNWSTCPSVAIRRRSHGPFVRTRPLSRGSYVPPTIGGRSRLPLQPH